MHQIPFLCKNFTVNPIQSKLPHVGTTIFTEMSVLANQYQAINLGQGFPDFTMSMPLVEKVHAAMKNGNNQYVHMNGLPVLRELLAKKYHSIYAASLDGETHITITPGGTYAIYTALTTVLQPGDEVIVFEPGYDSYIPTIELNGAVAITIPLQFPSYAVDWNLVKEKISPRTRMIMINSPHNPTGTILNPTDMEQLQLLVKNTEIFILSDEVYEHLIFNGFEHQSVLRYPELFKRSFVCFSFGKTYHCTGWKLGYCIAPEYLMKEFRKVHQFNCFSCNTPMQVGIASYLNENKDYLELGAMMQQKKDYFEKAMHATRFKALPSYGSYFQLYSYAGISDLHEKDFSVWLTKTHGVTTIPVTAFYKYPEEHAVVRFCFSKQESLLDAAVERLVNV
jgi:methionine aminotransferase